MKTDSQGQSMRRTGAQRLLRYALDVALEIVWPTRCAVCDMPGERVLCEACERKLEIIDLGRACERCGTPFGRVQCTECNDVMLAAAGMSGIPFDRMSHAVILDDAARRIVAVYKDADERRLVDDIARIMRGFIDPALARRGFVMTYIPDTAAAMRRRGFDHSQEIAATLAAMASMGCENLFERPQSIDQRKLGRSERIENMRSSMRVRSGIDIPERVLLVDDVCTTGATVYSACDALRGAGVREIHVLTFAQVMD